MSYNKYSNEMKEAIVTRMLSGEETMADVNRKTVININTLFVGEMHHCKRDCHQQPNIKMLINGVALYKACAEIEISKRIYNVGRKIQMII